MEKIDKSELSPEDYAARKAELVARDQKKRFSNIFVLCSSLFLIIETIIILGILVIPLFIIFSHFNIYSTGVGLLFGFLQMVVFVGGLLLGFVVFRAVNTLVIKKFHLENKLTDDVKKHLMKRTKEEREMELRR